MYAYIFKIAGNKNRTTGLGWETRDIAASVFGGLYFISKRKIIFYIISYPKSSHFQREKRTATQSSVWANLFCSSYSENTRDTFFFYQKAPKDSPRNRAWLITQYSGKVLLIRTSTRTNTYTRNTVPTRIIGEHIRNTLKEKTASTNAIDYGNWSLISRNCSVQIRCLEERPGSSFMQRIIPWSLPVHSILLRTH